MVCKSIYIMPQTLTWQDDDNGKYPSKIQKLFRPNLPFPYKKPVGYAPEKRATHNITPVSKWRSHIEQYKSEFPTKPRAAAEKAPSRKEKYLESFQRQCYEWEDTEAFAENKFIKDPYRTVFVARLYYALDELALSKLLSGFGAIESVRIVRDRNGKSRGYGFVVFERETDASTCIQELAPTGITVEPPQATKARKVLVDMERGRLVRSWKPRRLGGGLGGRHYTSPTSLHSRGASAASSGRRLNLSQNPYQQHSSKFQKRPLPDRYSSGDRYKRANTDQGHYPSAIPAYSAGPAFSSHTPAAARSSDSSIKDKYAKYSNSGSESRSIRSIRRE